MDMKKKYNHYKASLGKMKLDIISDLVSIAEENGGEITLPPGFLCVFFNNQEQSYYETITREGVVTVLCPDSSCTEQKLYEINMRTLLWFMESLVVSKEQYSKEQYNIVVPIIDEELRSLLRGEEFNWTFPDANDKKVEVNVILRKEED